MPEPEQRDGEPGRQMTMRERWAREEADGPILAPLNSETERQAFDALYDPERPEPSDEEAAAAWAALFPDWPYPVSSARPRRRRAS